MTRIDLSEYRDTIVIVEDKIDEAKALKDYLNSLKFNGDIHIIVDNLYDYKKLIKLKPDLVILDQLMVKLNGVDILNEIKNQKKRANDKPKVIFHSNFGEFKKLAKSLGADAYLSKTDPPYKIAKQIKILLDR